MGKGETVDRDVIKCVELKRGVFERESRIKLQL
jgi:hypothetical protein